MKRLIALAVPLIAQLGCSGGVANSVDPQQGEAVIRFEQAGAKLALASAPLKRDYDATYPNPRKLEWLEARISNTGRVVVSCKGSIRDTACSESPLLTEVVAGNLRVFDVYKQVLAELPYGASAACSSGTPDSSGATSGSAPTGGASGSGGDEGGSGSSTGDGETGIVSISLEELGAAVEPGACEGPPEGEPGDVTEGNPTPENLGGNEGSPPSESAGEACEAVQSEAQAEFCTLLNEKLKVLGLDYTYDCAHLSEAFVVPTPEGRPEESANEEIGCKRQVLKPVVEQLAQKFQVNMKEACGPGSSLMFTRWREKARLELFSQGVCGLSPLVLDLSGNGIELSTLKTGTRFDLLATGTAVNVAWIQQDDALLVRDLNGNGIVDSGSELFGNRTGGAWWQHGFQALAALDADANGLIDARDPAFPELRVWVDAGRDGVGPLSETRTVEEAGIRALSVASRFEPSSSDGRGNWIPYIGHFIRSDGSEGTMVDAFLRFQPSTMSPASHLVAR